jgi:tRNA threonylcarbamoyladenosine biosynthesis protein TsaB
MPSLRQLLAAHAPLLLLDAASETIQVGCLSAQVAPAWAARKEEAGVGIFRCLEELGVDVATIRAFAFCEGPGSILGIRTAAMALRTWNVLAARPSFAYSGLAVVAADLGRPDLGLIADARRGRWHHQTLGGAWRRVPAAELTGDLATPEGFRHWAPLPAGTARVPYDLPRMFAVPAVAAADLFRPVDAPDAFLHAEPAYAAWTPQIHRGP